MPDSQDTGTLVGLAGTSITVADPADDVRGRKVLDRNADEIGDVDDLLIDQHEGRVRMLRVAHGGFLGIGEDHFLVPVDAITRIAGEYVHIDREREKLSDVPGYQPKLAEDPAYYANIYGWWGYGPFWGAGYTFPGYPRYA